MGYVLVLFSFLLGILLYTVLCYLFDFLIFKFFSNKNKTVNVKENNKNV